MANTKKSRIERKKPMSFTAKTGIIEAFKDRCLNKGLVPSNVLEILMHEWINKYDAPNE